MKLKTEHYVLLAVLLIVGYFLFFKKEDDKTTVGTSVGYDPSAGGGRPDIDGVSNIDVNVITDRESGDRQQPLARVSVPPPRIVTEGSGSVGKSKWSRDRRAVITACRNSGGTFVEGTGENAGYFGCF